MFLGCNKTSQEPPDTSSYPTVRLKAYISSISVEDNFRIDVNVANIENLFAISFQISFDPSILEIIMESDTLNYGTFTDENFGPVVYSDSNGLLSVALGGNNINDEIFSIILKGKIAGTTNVELKEVNLVQDEVENVSNYSALVLENLILEDIVMTVTN